MRKDYAFEMAASTIRYGPGVTREVGMDFTDLGVKRVMLLTDPNLAKLPPVQTAIEALEAEKIHYAMFDRVQVLSLIHI